MQVQAQGNQTQIDRRIITAIIRAVAERGSFVVQYRDIYEQLNRIIKNSGEFYKLEGATYEAVSEGLLRGVYKFPGPCGDSNCDVVVVSPEPLSQEALKTIEYLTGLYQFKLYDGNEERGEVTKVLHNFVKMQTSTCLEAASPAKAVYELAKTYGLAVQEETQLDAWRVGKIIYKIEELDKPVVKEVYYCNRCLSFPDDEQFIEKCRSWRFA
jgi:hypothetical protein